MQRLFGTRVHSRSITPTLDPTCIAVISKTLLSTMGCALEPGDGATSGVDAMVSLQRTPKPLVLTGC